ncbi:MAG: hypothetical protein HY815_03080 [Candidatus Riflebacteria bacterium]|nr:hypothetical protein [Candidatus Riflebacteria bacterium]
MANVPLGEVWRGSVAELMKMEAATAPTVSGVCVDSTGRLVAASTWTSRHHYGPTLLFRLEGTSLEHCATLVHQWLDPIGDPCPTGVVLFRQRIVVRCNTSTLADSFAVLEPPASVLAQTEPLPPHLTSGRVAIVKGTILTGGGGSLALGGWRADMGAYEAGKACAGLAALDWGSDPSVTRAIPVPSCRRVTAICPDPDGRGFTTGGLNGEVDRWTWDGSWVPHRLREPCTRSRPELPGLTWATYTATSIVGACHLGDSGHWLTVDAGGEVQLWGGQECRLAWQLPHPGTPRSIAAHPKEPWFAVAIKAGFMGEESAIVLAKVENSRHLK